MLLMSILGSKAARPEWLELYDTRRMFSRSARKTVSAVCSMTYSRVTLWGRTQALFRPHEESGTSPSTRSQPSRYL